MFCESRYKEHCPCLNEEVELRIVIAAEIGNTCAISFSDAETECSVYESCPYRRRSGCLLLSAE